MISGAAIVSDKQLGDVLLLQPCGDYLAEKTGKSTALFVRDVFKPMIDLMPGCAWGPEGEKKFSEVWSTSWSSRAVWQALRLRSPNRRLIVNKSRHLRWWYRLVFHEIRLEPPSAEYWARYFWRIVSGQPAEAFIAPRLNLPPPEWCHPALPMGGFILINPTAAWQRKFWGVEQWAELITRLFNEDPLVTLVIAGGSSEREIAHCAAIVESAGVPVVNLAGQTSLKQYLHLLAGATLVVCIDGAASHLAQAFQVPTVTVFGPTHEGKWHWPTSRHIALAARNYNESQSYGPASGVPVYAMWEAVCAARMP